ncbi:MAG: cell division protein FtsZ [Rhodospirillaceae bacterium]|nr:cell division protein FtsZ [Rhodospirillaceae bacterium]MBL6930255.1 cell division protein FtsZ [Rhodospirillales bacterium]MBL6940848.1 cell division protein FtsZ [Rhodospirillales bacterium]
MSINLTIPNSDTPQLKPRITVFGVGGAGGNAVNNMIDKQLEGVDFVVANTDAQALSQSKADSRIQLGATITQGLGAGSKPEVGRAAAEESLAELEEQIKDSHMVFIAAGMGGGTGTGAAPVVARAAKERGILTVGVVTKPFQFEGMHRYKLAESGIEDLEQFVDTLIVIPNQNLFRVANEQTTFADAFNMADEVLYSGVRGVTDLMVMPGLINLDFADIRSVMSEMGKAMMGTGEAEGERRALDAAEAAIANPLLDDCSMAGAKGVLINITGGQDMTLFEADEAANRIRSEVDTDAYIIFGSTFDDSLEGYIRVSVVATGMDREAMAAPAQTFLSVSSPVARQVIEESASKVEEAAPTPAVAETATPETVEDQSFVDLAGMATASTQNTAIEDDVDLDIPTAESTRAALDMAEAEDTITESVGETVAETQAEPELETEAEVAAERVIDQGEPAPATPGQNEEDVFIPDTPMSATGEEAVKPADPFAAAAMANGAKSREEKPAASAPKAKGMGLFARVTGLAGGNAESSEPAEPVMFKPKAPTPIPAPVLASSPVPTPEPAPELAKEQNSLGGLDQADRLESSQPEEDLLDIPAFLRRQAN